MTNFTNMKIPVEGNLDEIVAELERLGYWWIAEDDHKNSLSVLCFNDGYCSFRSVQQCKYTTTLSELKAMK